MGSILLTLSQSDVTRVKKHLKVQENVSAPVQILNAIPSLPLRHSHVPSIYHISSLRDKVILLILMLAKLEFLCRIIKNWLPRNKHTKVYASKLC